MFLTRLSHLLLLFFSLSCFEEAGADRHSLATSCFYPSACFPRPPPGVSGRSRRTCRSHPCRALTPSIFRFAATVVVADGHADSVRHERPRLPGIRNTGVAAGQGGARDLRCRGILCAMPGQYTPRFRLRLRKKQKKIFHAGGLFFFSGWVFAVQTVYVL